MTDVFSKTAYGFIITEEICFCIFSFFSPDAIYDCASLYNKNYKISGEYKLPKDEFLGTPEMSVSYSFESAVDTAGPRGVWHSISMS